MPTRFNFIVTCVCKFITKVKHNQYQISFMPSPADFAPPPPLNVAHLHTPCVNKCSHNMKKRAGLHTGIYPEKSSRTVHHIENASRTQTHLGSPTNPPFLLPSHPQPRYNQCAICGFAARGNVINSINLRDWQNNCDGVWNKLLCATSPSRMVFGAASKLSGKGKRFEAERSMSCGVCLCFWAKRLMRTEFSGMMEYGDGLLLTVFSKTYQNLHIQWCENSRHCA